MGSATTICSDKTGTLTLNQVGCCCHILNVVHFDGYKDDPWFQKFAQPWLIPYFLSILRWLLWRLTLVERKWILQIMFRCYLLQSHHWLSKELLRIRLEAYLSPRLHYTFIALLHLFVCASCCIPFAPLALIPVGVHPIIPTLWLCNKNLLLSMRPNSCFLSCSRLNWWLVA